MTKIDLPAGQAAANAGADQAQALKRKLGQAAASGGADEKGLKKTCQDFEAIFMGKLWQQMRATVPKEGYLHGPQEDAYLSMFDEELSKKMASAGGIGIANMLLTQLKAQLSQTPPGAQAATPQGVRPLNAQGAETGAAATAVRPLDAPAAAAATSVHRNGIKPLDNPSRAAAATPIQREALRPTQAPEAAKPPLRPETAAAASVPSAVDVARSVDELARRIEAQGGIEAPAARSAALPEIVWPAAGQVVSGFGQGGGGVEIAVREAGVKACQEGRVVFAGKRAGQPGVVVEIEHPDGLRSAYAGMDKAAVKAGDAVEAGREIAMFAGKEGIAGRRLSFELRHGSVALNPELLRGGPLTA